MKTEQKWKIGDAYELIKELPSDSVDLVVTDPPYGYSFMGLDWDKAVPKTEIWQECLRVLKPGAFAFIMSSPRQDVLSQMIVRIGQAGFKTDFTSIYWTYASGFPKAMNIGKAIDKKAGIQREVIGQKKLNPRDKKVYTPNSYDGLQGSSTFEKNPSMNMITAPSSAEAKLLDGSYAGFQPKPAVEVIIVAMKPLSEKTYIEQALKNGKGITWLDKGRIPFQSKDDFKEVVYNYKGGIERATDSKETWKLHDGGWKLGEGIEVPDESKGRFPANLLVSDDVLNDGRILICGTSTKHTPGKEYMGHGGKDRGNAYLGDFGSYSRYFDLDKWFDETIKKLPKEVRGTLPFLIIGKPCKSEKNKDVDNPRTNINSPKNNNHHPTVKPLKLFSYLITIGSRENDTI